MSLVPSLTAAAALLGRSDDIVGITDYCTEPTEVVARAVRVGGTKNPDLAAIEALDPDVILANTDEQRGETLDQLVERFGAEAVCVTETDDLERLDATWLQLGTVLDAESEAEVQREALAAAVHAATAAARPRPRLAALVPVWKSPWMASGSGTYVEALLDTCGFDNLWEDVEEKWLRFTLSTDPAAAGMVEKGPSRGQRIHALPRVPDVVLLPTEPYVFDESHRGSFETIGVGPERVRVVDGQLLTWWLSHTVEALQWLSALHEELAAGVTGTGATSRTGS